MVELHDLHFPGAVIGGVGSEGAEIDHLPYFLRIFVGLLQVLLLEGEGGGVLGVWLLEQAVEAAEDRGEVEEGRPILFEDSHMNLPCHWVDVHVVDLVKKCQEGRVLWIRFRYGQSNSIVKMRVRRVG